MSIDSMSGADQERDRYAEERSHFMLWVHGRPIGMGEELVYESREHAVGAAVRLKLSVPIDILQARRFQPFFCETIQPHPEFTNRSSAIARSIWELYLLGWKLTTVKLECSCPHPAAYREG